MVEGPEVRGTPLAPATRAQGTARVPLRLSRRALLRSSTALTVIGWRWPGAAGDRVGGGGEPFTDGTFFDDGFGFCD